MYDYMTTKYVCSSLVFVDQPYFNEPSYETTMHTPEGKRAGEQYNASIRNYTAQFAIAEQIAKPSYFFRDIIREHFRIKLPLVRDQMVDWKLPRNHIELVFREMNAVFPEDPATTKASLDEALAKHEKQLAEAHATGTPATAKISGSKFAKSNPFMSVFGAGKKPVAAAATPPASTVFSSPFTPMLSPLTSMSAAPLFGAAPTDTDPTLMPATASNDLGGAPSQYEEDELNGEGYFDNDVPLPDVGDDYEEDEQDYEEDEYNEPPPPPYQGYQGAATANAFQPANTGLGNTLNNKPKYGYNNYGSGTNTNTAKLGSAFAKELNNEGGQYSNDDLARAIEFSMKSQQEHASKYGQLTYEQTEEAEYLEALAMSLVESGSAAASSSSPAKANASESVTAVAAPQGATVGAAADSHTYHAYSQYRMAGMTPEEELAAVLAMSMESSTTSIGADPSVASSAADTGSVAGVISAPDSSVKRSRSASGEAGDPGDSQPATTLASLMTSPKSQIPTPAQSAPPKPVVAFNDDDDDEEYLLAIQASLNESLNC
jgi:hypothetical protein